MQAGLKKRALRLLDDVTAAEGSLLFAPGEVLAALVRARSPRAANLVFTFTSGVDPRWTGQHTLRVLLDAQRRGYARGTIPASVVASALEHVVCVLEGPGVTLPEIEVPAPPRDADDEDGVGRWARAHDVEPLLRLPAHHVAHRVQHGGRPWLQAAFRRESAHLKTLRKRTLARVRSRRGFEDEILIVDEIDRLLRSAAKVRAQSSALLEEQPDLNDLPAPDEEVHAGVLARLLELRARTAGAHGLTLGPRLHEPTALALEEDPPAFVTYGNQGGHRVELSAWRTAALEITRGHSAEENDLGVDAALCALEAMIDVVREPCEREREALIDLIGRAPWQRLLVALETSAPGQKRAAPEVAEVSWRLESAWHGFEPVPYLHKRKKAGGLTAGTRLALQRILDDDKLPLVAQDRAAASAQLGARHAMHPNGAALEALEGHPRVYLEDDLTTPISIERTPLSLLVDEVSGGFRLGVGLGPLRLDAVDVSEALERGRALVTVSAAKATLHVTRVDKQLRPLLDTLCRVDAVIPAEEKDALLRAVHPYEEKLAVRLPAPLQGDVVEAAVLPVVRLDPLAGGALRVSVGVRSFEGAPFLVPGEGEPELTALVEGRRVTARRDLERERSGARALVEELPLPDHSEDGPWRYYLADAEEALDVIGALAPDGVARDGVAIEWPEEKPRVRVGRTLTAAALRVEVSERKDWLGLEGGADIDGERVALALLLDEARKGARYIALSNDRFIQLSKELRAKLTSLAEAASEVRGHVEVGLAAASALCDLQQAGAAVEGTRVWTELLERMRAARDLSPTLPRALTADLRPYQLEGFAWLKRLSTWGVGAVLADDMGLGKTLQAIALLVDRQQLGPQLVVAPTSVCFSWQREIERFAPSLRARLLAGNDRKALLEELGPRDVVIASWGVLLRDIDELSRRRFATFVMDEAQAIKNAATRRARAARDIDADWRLALTGTPVENHLGELWAIFRAAAPGLLGSWEQFKARFAVPIERHRDEKARRALSRLIRPFLLRRTKAAVAEDLPARTEVVHHVELSDDERRAYEDVRLAILAKLEGDGAPSVWDGQHQNDKRFEILSALTRLRMRACHPALDGDHASTPSSKQKAVLRIAANLKDGGHRALVFSQFTSHLGLLRGALEQEGFTTLYLDGSTPQAERARLVDRFQGGEGDLFLISLKAGGVGLNLTAADYVLLLDPWWNPAVEDQAADRAHRIGQQKPVTIYKLVARGTIEESILSLQADKRRLVDDVLEGSGSAGSLSTRELVALIEQRGHMEARLVPAP